jgi:hypothetical protein
MDAKVLADDPATFFARDSFAAHRMDRSTMERLQLGAIRYRFEALRGRVKALDILIRETGVHEIGSFADAVQLLLPHGIYKSYPDRWLVQGHFGRMTGWLQSFTTCDLSPALQGDCETIDGWLDGLDTRTALRLCHSSGTTGKLSFFPRGAADVEAGKTIFRLNLAQWFDKEGASLWDYDFNVVHLAPRRGRAGIARSVKQIESILVPPGAMYVLDDSPASVDVQFFLSRTQDAMRRGTTVGMEITPYIAARLDEQRARTENIRGDYQRLHDLLVGPLQGQFTMVFGGTPMLWALAKFGLELGGRGVLDAGGGHMVTAGGLKGQKLDDGWEDGLRRYFGRATVSEAYGMTEIIGGATRCRAGRFHCPPWLIPFVLDRDSGHLLPREGVQSGRAAFFDLTPRTHWGGVISADLLIMSWEPCACGRTTPHLGPEITRQLDGSDDGLTSATSREAIAALVEGCAER